MAKKKTKKVTEEVVAQVEETVVEQPTVEPVEETPLTREEAKALEKASIEKVRALFSKK